MTIDEFKALSLDEQEDIVEKAFYAQVFPPDPASMMMGGAIPEDADCCEVYPAYVIYCDPDGFHWQVNYTISAEGVVFDPREMWVKVEKQWKPMKSADVVADTYIAYGSEVKTFTDGTVGGYLVLFGTPDTADFDGDYFTANTDYGFEGEIKTPIYYHHGLDSTMKLRKLGEATIGKDDVGVFIKGQLALRDEYEKAIDNMLIKRKKTGWSSGTASHLVERKSVGNAQEVTRWHLGLDASITPTPNDWRQVVALKSVDTEPVAIKSLIDSQLEVSDEPGVQLPEAEQSAVSTAITGTDNATVIESVHTIETEESVKMTDNQQPPADSLEAKFAEQGARLDAALKALENLPISKNPGYFTADGGTADKEIKSFGDYLIAVRRGDVKRLENVYNVKALGEDQGGTGGYSVPDEFQPRLLEVAAQNSGIVSELEAVPVTSPRGKIPALDMFFTPTAGDGQTAFAGGLNPSAIAESGAYSSSDPGFELIEWSINKIGFKTTVSNELMSDSPISMEALLTRLAGIAIGAKTEMYVLRGTGAGVPLGILNAPATVSYSAASSNTFAYADASGMIARHLATSNKVRWLMHKSTIPDITRFEVGTGGAVWMANVSAGMGNMPLLGYPIIFSEHLPKADNAGHVILADLGAYLLFTKGNISVAFSEHADFGNGNVVWRFDRRLDGQPWMKSAVTDGNPQGSYTTSPFVQFNN